MNKKIWLIILASISIIVVLFLTIRFFSEESQNSFNRSLQTTIGLKNGKVEVYVGQAVPVRRFFNVEKLSTAISTVGKTARNYRYGFGYIDSNKNNILDIEEKKRGKKYFELSEFSQYIYLDASN